ncbi:MAG: helix-turn-helix transcriptional regulator [Microthrixaceae bacterium]
MGEADAVAWLRAVCRVVHDPFVVVQDSVVVEANAAAEALFGRSPLCGAPVASVLPVAADEHGHGAFATTPRDAVADRGDTGTAARIRDAAGELRSVRWRCVQSGTTAVHVFEQVHDLTGLPGADGAGDAARLATLEAGLRNISWELRTLGFLDPVATGSPISPEQLRNLSPREREVLRSFLDGCSVATSARLLHVSEHTVRSHLKSVYRKLGVRSQTELLRAMRNLDPRVAPVE